MKVIFYSGNIKKNIKVSLQQALEPAYQLHAPTALYPQEDKRKRQFGIFRLRRVDDMEICLTQDACGCGG
jgi:hypothetical protein